MSQAALVKDADEDLEPSAEDLDEIDLTEYEDDEDLPTKLDDIFHNASDPVKDYLRDIGKRPLLTAEQEVELAKAIEAGLYAQYLLDSGSVSRQAKKRREELESIAQKGRDDKAHLLEANLRLVVSLAKRYTGRGMLFLDLIQEGNIGLIRAVQKFDYTKGFKFSTYAVWWIRQEVTRAIANSGRTVRLPIHKVEMINKIFSTTKQLLGDLGREPSPAEVGAALDISADEVEGFRALARDPVSIYAPIGEDGSVFADIIQAQGEIDPGAAADHAFRRDALQTALVRMPYDQARVLELLNGFYGVGPLSPRETGIIIGATTGGVRALEKQALEVLADMLGAPDRKPRKVGRPRKKK